MMNTKGFTILLEKSYIINGKDEVKTENATNITVKTDATGTETGTATTAEAPPTSVLGGGSLLQMVLMYAVIFGAAYFFWIRPQKKKEQKVREMQTSITTGNDIVTSSGFYGKVVDVTENAFVIEFGTNKGVRVPVRKGDVFLAKEAVEEEKTKLTK